MENTAQLTFLAMKISYISSLGDSQSDVPRTTPSHSPATRAFHLCYLDPHSLAEEAERHRGVVGCTFLQATEVNRVLGQSRRRPSLQPAHGEPQPLQRLRQPDGRLIP